MRRVVLDANVYVSALLAPAGSPAKILEQWADGQFDVMMSPLLLAELERVLRRPKFTHLTQLSDPRPPVLTPREFRDILD